MQSISPRCRKAIELAIDSVHGLGQSNVASSHLILGLLLLKNGVATNILEKSGVTAEKVSNFLSGRPDPNEKLEVFLGFGLFQSAIETLKRAEQEAVAMSYSLTGTEHLLLSLLGEEKGEANAVFSHFEVDRLTMRRIITDELNQSNGIWK